MFTGSSSCLSLITTSISCRVNCKNFKIFLDNSEILESFLINRVLIFIDPFGTSNKQKKKKNRDIDPKDRQSRFNLIRPIGLISD